MAKKHRKLKIILLICAAVLIMIGITGTVYVNDYYHADDYALACLDSSEGVTITREEIDGKVVVFRPETVQAGFIFYPGGKVQYEAYAPLMKSLAEKGILCILLKMPANLAVLDIDNAKGIQEAFPEVTSWYIGGHSLGGAMAATYVADHVSEYDGLILCAAYSTKDLSAEAMDILAIFGSDDGVMKRDSYDKYRTNLGDCSEYVIDGGCHAFFGSYGPQKGDGTPAITVQQQTEIAANVIYEEMIN